MASERSNAMDEAGQAAEGSGTDRLLERLADRIGAHSGVQAAFGEPISRGELTVVPVARTRWLFGGGTGSGGDRASEGGYGSGSGGGGRVVADPVGYVEIGPSGATFRPIIEPYPRPLFLLACGVTAAIVIRALARLIRG